MFYVSLPYDNILTYKQEKTLDTQGFLTSKVLYGDGGTCDSILSKWH